MTSTPPGFYDDGQGQRRWWDGRGWTSHLEPAPSDAAAAGGPSTPLRILIGTAVGLIAIALLGVVGAALGSHLATPRAAATHQPAASAVPAAAASAEPPSPNYAARARHYIRTWVCDPRMHNQTCTLITGYGMIGDAIVVHTRIYPDSDAAQPAQSICGFVLMYVNDAKASADDLSSTAYVYGSTGSRIAKCTTPADR